MTEEARSLRSADGQTLAWHVRGPLSGPESHPVVLVHGLASNASRFEEFAQTTSLAERHPDWEKGGGGALVRCAGALSFRP